MKLFVLQCYMMPELFSMYQINMMPQSSCQFLTSLTVLILWLECLLLCLTLVTLRSWCCFLVLIQV